MKNSFYVTTPIYYVNSSPHIGHAYTTILADVLARSHRLRHDPTFFLTGTDEHGQKVQQAAEKAGLTPQQHVDRMVPLYQALWTKLEITHDDFIRTTEARHREVVSRILQDLYDRGEIYRDEYDGWYCVPCERFFMEKDLADGACAECHRPVEHIREANYFFRMSKYQDWLIDHIQQHPEFIQPDFRRNETLGFLRRKLGDLCISRPKRRLSWGIPLPFDPEFVTYVWFDALVNYISAVGYLADPARFAQWWPASFHLIGKDILTTHTVYWPTMLKAMGVPLPRTIFAHGWWLVGESKMSKSLGNIIDPMEFVDRFGADAFRYFVMAEMVPGHDAGFTEEAFARRYNADLANDLGNLLSRLVKMVSSYTGGRIPAPAGPEGEDERALREAALKAAAAMDEAADTLRFDLGLGAVSAALREGNRYIENRQPWSLAKKGEQAALGTALYSIAELLRIASGALYPVMPGKMAELRRALGIEPAEPQAGGLREWGLTKAGAEVGPLKSLFPRLEAEKPAAVPAAAAASAKPAAEAAPAAPAVAPAPQGVVAVEYADFSRLQLRTARILEAARVEGADKLLRLRIVVGGEERQIVAGIAQHYKPEELPGRTIVVVANLKPAVIRGVESRGMLLAASSGKTLRLVTVDGEMPDGSVVK